MEIGLFAPVGHPFGGPDYVEALGRGAEARGFSSLWLAEHVVLFDEYASRYPYADDGRIPARGDAGFHDPFAALAFLAALTTRIHLGTGVCLVPQRNPVYTAKDVATVDVLSRGRFRFGVGIGWLAEEFAALDVPFERRGARARAYLEVMRRLWCDDVSAYEGPFYRLPPCRQYPKPAQRPHPPIYFGGESDAALRRVADLGQGWYPFDVTPDVLTARLGVLDGLLAERGRRRADVRLVTCPYMRQIDLDTVKRYRDLGVEEVVFLVFAPDAEALARTLDALAETWVVPARAL